MAGRVETKYGLKALYSDDDGRAVTQYGEPLELLETNNMANDLRVEYAPGTDSRLLGIMELRSAIAQCPQPGDEVFLKYLKEDEELIIRGISPDKLVAETYPELPARVTSLIAEINSISLEDSDLVPAITKADVEAMSTERAAEVIEALLDELLYRQAAKPGDYVLAV